MKRMTTEWESGKGERHRQCPHTPVLPFLPFILFIVVSVAHARPTFPKEEFAQRRARLFEKIPDGVAILFGAETPEAYLKFRQANTFFYFTGVEMPESALIMDGATRKATLYVPDRLSISVAQERLVRAGPQGVARTGIESVLSSQQLNDGLTQALTQAKRAYL